MGMNACEHDLLVCLGPVANRCSQALVASCFILRVMASRVCATGGAGDRGRELGKEIEESESLHACVCDCCDTPFFTPTTG